MPRKRNNLLRAQHSQTLLVLPPICNTIPNSGKGMRVPTRNCEIQLGNVCRSQLNPTRKAWSAYSRRIAKTHGLSKGICTFIPRVTTMSFDMLPVDRPQISTGLTSMRKVSSLLSKAIQARAPRPTGSKACCGAIKMKRGSANTKGRPLPNEPKQAPQQCRWLSASGILHSGTNKLWAMLIQFNLAAKSP